MQIAVNTFGNRIGEDHPNSKLTDHEVELVRSLRESGMTYPLLAEKFGITKWAIGRICRYERRAQVAVRFKTISDPVIPYLSDS